MDELLSLTTEKLAAVASLFSGRLSDLFYSIDVGDVRGLLDYDSAKKAIAVIIAIIFAPILIKSVVSHLRKKHIKKLAAKSEEMTPEDFLERRSQRAEKGKTQKLLPKEFDGIYILYNKSRKKYYVGQSVHVLYRINQHFTGHGNGDVYYDWRSGDRFTIRTVHLRGSGFRTLNSLERNAIAAYKARSRGYNKTKGNRG